MTNRKPTQSFPERKISDTFLDFAAPLFQQPGYDPSKKEIETALQLAAAVWNGVVFDSVNGNGRYIAEARRLVAADPASAQLVEHLIARKRNEFADDERLIGHHELKRKGGEWRLRVEARDPRSRSSS